MDGRGIYDMVNSQLNIKDRRLYLSSLTQEQKLLYTRYNNKVRQDKFKANEANKEKYNDIRKEHIKELRINNPEKMKAQNIKDDWRQKVKLLEPQYLESKAKSTGITRPMLKNALLTNNAFK
jgi:hypothetical protein